jgi:GT2 family glycosyltransferase
VLVVVTPVRGAEPEAALVSLGWANFRLQLGQHAYTQVTYEPVLARNRLAAMALENKEMRAVLWLDDDNYAKDPSVVQRMLDTREDLVGAPYARKKHPVEWAHRRMTWGFALGFGFTITSRRCLEEMTRSARIYTDRADGVTRKVADLFSHLYSGPTEDDQMYSEDVSFCRRWANLGGKPALYGDGAGEIMHVGGHAFVSG